MLSIFWCKMSISHEIHTAVAQTMHLAFVANIGELDRMQRGQRPLQMHHLLCASQGGSFFWSWIKECFLVVSTLHACYFALLWRKAFFVPLLPVPKINQASHNAGVSWAGHLLAAVKPILRKLQNRPIAIMALPRVSSQCAPWGLCVCVCHSGLFNRHW